MKQRAPENTFHLVQRAYRSLLAFDEVPGTWFEPGPIRRIRRNVPRPGRARMTQIAAVAAKRI
jgi:hypothetical protein